MASKKHNNDSAPETEYLDPMRSVGYLTRINFRAFSRALERSTLKHGVSSGQWRFLRVLWDEDGLTQRELSDRVGTQEATTVLAVRGLIEAGLAKRDRSSVDKRKYFVRLTGKGRALRNKLMPMVVQVNETALSGISAQDIDTTRRVLVATHNNLMKAFDEESD